MCILNIVILIKASFSFLCFLFLNLGPIFLCLAIIPNSYATHQHTVADIKDEALKRHR